MHARSGGAIEVMGMLHGKVIGNSIVIMDAFGLPVEGTETRVNASAAANEFMIDHIEQMKLVRLSFFGLSLFNVCPYRFSGCSAGERARMVSQPPRLRMLAVRDRR